MQLSEISFKKLYQQIKYKLKKLYSNSSAVFTAASPFGQILTVVTELFQLNQLQTQNVQRSLDVNEVMNQNEKAIRMIAKVGQYNPARAQSSNGSIRLQIKSSIDINSEISGGKITFINKSKLKNKKTNLDYLLFINQDQLTYTLNNTTPMVLNIVQGVWRDDSTFTGTGEINQSYTIPQPTTKDIDNFIFKVYVNDELWTIKKHKYDLLENEKGCVVYTGFAGGVDIIFGNGSEGFIPPLGSIIRFEYLLTDGQQGNIVNADINDFIFIDQPIDYYGDEVNVEDFFDIFVHTQIAFGSDGESIEHLKSILPFASPNFVLSGTEQYKFFLKRLGIFSIIDVYVQENTNRKLTKDIFDLAKKNTDLLNQLLNKDNNNSIRNLIQSNLDQIKILNKLIISGAGTSLINIFLIPDIRIFWGRDTDINYFNIDINNFILSSEMKTRIEQYLTTEGIQVISNEINVIDPVIKQYVLNVTARLYDDAVEENTINEITNKVSEYFVTLNRRDRIPASDINRILDQINDIDSVNVEFISKDTEAYHKEYLIKAEQFNQLNGRIPFDNEILMSDGKTYNKLNSPGLDYLLGDILIEKEELPLVRGGFTDRYNNYYGIEPAKGKYSSINILILPDKTKRKKIN